MAALRHIKLTQYKGLKGALLSELEKINVVCGPNNSGKTTVLECIANRNFLFGLEVSVELAQSIAALGLKGGTGWGGGSRAAALTELGYSIADNLVSDLVVLCEGPKDKPVLEEFFQKMGLLDRTNIKVWPLGGDIMDQLDLSVFQESHKLIALVDNDPGSSAVRKRFQKKCEELKIPVTRLKRYALENYFSIAAISAYMKGQMPTGVTELVPDKPVVEQLGFELKKNGGKIAKEMKLEDLKGTDLEEFLNQVAKLATEERVKSTGGAN